jgi:hypothetical protein
MDMFTCKYTPVVYLCLCFVKYMRRHFVKYMRRHSYKKDMYS